MHLALRLLKKIPKGKVASYKEMARVCKTSPRAIGRIMAGNGHPVEYPCYKVVASSGELTGYSAPGGITKKRELLRRDGVEVTNGRVDNKYFYRFSSVLIFFLLVPMVVGAQTSSSTPGVASTTPAASSTPAAAPVIGRTQDISFVGDVVEVKSGGMLVISPTLSARQSHSGGVGQPSTGSSSAGIISIDANTAQIIKAGKKNVSLAALAPGDHVRVKGKILPDGSYLAQHVQTISKTTSAKRATSRASKIKHSTRIAKQRILQKSKKAAQVKKTQPNKQPARKNATQ